MKGLRRNTDAMFFYAGILQFLLYLFVPIGLIRGPYMWRKKNPPQKGAD